MKSLFNLEGKIALITGASRGIGWGIASRLAECGAIVVMNDVTNEDILKERVKTIQNNFGIESEYNLFDVADSQLVKEAYSSIFKKYKKLDILVNNAGILEDNLLGMISDENINRTLKINVAGVINNIQYASRLMARNSSGSIINITSIIGSVGNTGQVVYGGSKAAVIGITKSASKELAPKNIRVNAVAPGFIDTEMTVHLNEKIYIERLNSIKMGRIGTPQDIANAVLFFASDLSSYITGQVLGVDGCMLI